jgi:predicted nucleic acid-binding protein
MVTLDANVWIAAYDARDAFHGDSVAFMKLIGVRRTQVYGPAFVIVEAGCAVTRRTGSVHDGQLAMQGISNYPLLTLLPLDQQLLSVAADAGLRHMVRGADALYVAAALLTGAPLISWDNELVQRAGAVTPADWLSANPS